MTATGRSARYAYYLCDTRGCVVTRKSIRKEVLEGDFEKLLHSLQPSEGLFHLAFQMFRDLWNAKLQSAQGQGASLQKDIKEIERKVAQLLDRIVDASSDTIALAYEKRITELETQKAVMQDRLANCGRPLQSFGEAYRTAFDFLASPWKLWNSPRLEDRRAVLKLAFADQLAYVKGEGYRTANISMPFKLLGSLGADKKEMVPALRLELP